MVQVDKVQSVTNTAQSANTSESNPARMVTDSASKDIQSKILDAQKQRQGLSFNREMTSEEKENIRQKIQQEISDLKRELRRREAEEKKKQQEAQKAAKAQEEQKEKESKETVKEQQSTKPAQDVNGQTQESVSRPDNVNGTSGLQTEENKGLLPDGMQKVISAGASVRQFRTVRSAASKNDAAARMREMEMKQDEVRGADVQGLKKEQRADLQKETKRMETVQSFMFEGTNKTMEPSSGVWEPVPVGLRGKGLYNNNGMMFRNNFQSVQMDLKQ